MKWTITACWLSQKSWHMTEWGRVMLSHILYCNDDCVEKNPSIKVHRVADPLFFSPNLSLTLVQSVVHWYCVLVRSRGAVVSFPVWSHWLKDGFNYRRSVGRAVDNKPPCSCTDMEELPSPFCYEFFFYSKFWAAVPYFSKYKRPSLLIPAWGRG